MTCRKVSTILPKTLIEELQKSGATVRDKCEIHIVELATLDEPKHSASEVRFLEWLKGPEEVDPLVTVSFGPVISNYICPAAQAEVLSIINSYQPLDQDQLAAGNVPWQPIAALPLGGFQYHHAKIALQMMQQEIENPGHLLAQCPTLSLLPAGHCICDLTINYTNCAVARRLRKF